MPNIKDITKILTDIDNQSVEVKKLIYSALASELSNAKVEKKSTRIGMIRPSKMEIIADENKLLQELKVVGGMTIDEAAKFLGMERHKAVVRMEKLYKANPHIKRNNATHPIIFFYQE